MLGIEKLMEIIFNRENTPKNEREEFDVEGKFIHGLLFYNSYFDTVAKALPKQTICFLVGGWVRDRLINRPIGKKIDVDFIVTTDPFEIVKNLQKLVGGSIFQFEKDKKVASIVFFEEDTRYRFDFSYLDISDIMSSNADLTEKEKRIIKRIEEDLLQRDFTINAIAVNFDDTLGLGASQTVLFDPANGLEDINEGIIRPISFENIEDDPVRILRGYRLAQELEFKIEKNFDKWVSKNKELIKNSPKERIRDELLKIFDNEGSSKTLEKLIEKHLLQEIIPEIEAMVKIKKQEEYHKYPLIEHSLKTVDYMEDFLKKKTNL
jgi:poly(A) polymerase